MNKFPKNQMIAIIVLFSSLIPVSAYTLTLKTGEVIGADGKVYHGASPSQLEASERKFKQSGKSNMVLGNLLFINVDGTLINFSIPILRQKRGKELENFIREKIKDALKKSYTDSKIIDVASETTENQTEEQAAAEEEAIGKAREKTKDTAISAAIETTTSAIIDNTTNAAVEATIGTATDAAVEAATNAAVEAATDAAVEAATDAAIEAATESAKEAAEGSSGGAISSEGGMEAENPGAF